MLFSAFLLGTHIHSCPILWGSGGLVTQIANGSPHEGCEILSLVIATGATRGPRELLFVFSPGIAFA